MRALAPLPFALAAVLLAAAAPAQTRPTNQMHDGPRLDTGAQLDTDSHTAGRSKGQDAMARKLQAKSAKNNCRTVKDKAGKSMVKCDQPK